MSRAADLARQALDAGLKAKTPLFISPGSERIYRTMERDGLLDVFQRMGATVLTNACGPCIGQWSRPDAVPGRADSIISSFNRNFPGRNDGIAETCSFIASPEIVTALAFAGHPGLRSAARARLGRSAVPLPGAAGRGAARQGLRRRATRASCRPRTTGDGHRGRASIPPASACSLLAPFAPWDGQDFLDLPVLVKTKGKTTTDHISPAGKWLRFRGHLDRISDNMFLGATNAFTGERGKGTTCSPASGPGHRPDRPALQGPGARLHRRRRRELRRGQQPRARGHVARATWA